MLDSLEAVRSGTPDEIFFEAALALGIASLRDISARSHLDAEQANSAIAQLVKSGMLIVLEDGQPGADAGLLAAPAQAWAALADRGRRVLSSYHSKWPLRTGMPREELKSRLELSAHVFQVMLKKLIADGAAREAGTLIALDSHRVQFNREQQSTVDRLLRRFEEDPFGPPSLKDCEDLAGTELVTALISSGQLVQVSPEVLFRRVDYDSMVAGIKTVLSARGQITLAEVRDLFHTSRKYAQALLEHLDAIGATRRSGDVRLPGK